jgi:hypothetical protein
VLCSLILFLVAFLFPPLTIGDFVLSLYFFGSYLSPSAQLMPKRKNILNNYNYNKLHIQADFRQAGHGGQIWFQIANFGQ